MSEQHSQDRWSLSYATPWPDDPAERKRATVLRVGAYVAVVAAIVAAIVQFQAGTMRNLRKAERFDQAHPGWRPAVIRAGGPQRPKAHKGAIGRWRRAVSQMWDGHDIYGMLPTNYSAVQTQPVSSADTSADYGLVYMHPNSLFTVLVLTPFAYMPVWAMALSYNLLKAGVLIAAVLMAARLAGQGARRVPDWVVFLGFVWVLPAILGDLAHGNTNILALGAVVCHLWLYRQGRDWLAGLPLAAGILLKMTPALFLLYWLYQRNGKLLAGTLAAGVLLGAVLPAVAVGPDRYVELTGSWIRNVVAPGSVGGSWYPDSINQSLSGVVSRYFLAGRDGDIFWGPDDDPHYQTRKHGWITLVALSSAAAQWVLRAGRAAVVIVAAWAIGWRSLPRDDGRRALQYGIVLLAMMLINQRTWGHHAAVLLPACVAIWQATAYGNLSRRRRLWALGLLVAAGALEWLLPGDLIGAIAPLLGADPATAGDRLDAYGPTFYSFLCLFAAAILLAVSLRQSQDPYAEKRWKLLPKAR